MGLLSKLFGTEKKIITTNEKLLEYARQLIIPSQLNYYEKKIMSQYHQEKVALQMCEYVGSIMLQPTNNPIPHSLADKILRSQFIERFATYYGLNCFFAGWLLGYAENRGNLGLYQDKIKNVVLLLQRELEEELLRYFNNHAVCDAFMHGCRFVTEKGYEKSNQ